MSAPRTRNELRQRASKLQRRAEGLVREAKLAKEALDKYDTEHPQLGANTCPPSHAARMRLLLPDGTRLEVGLVLPDGRRADCVLTGRAIKAEEGADIDVLPGLLHEVDGIKRALGLRTLLPI